MMRLPQQLCHADVQAQTPKLLAAAQAADWVVDAASLTHFDSSALALLLAFKRASGGALLLKHMPQKLLQLAALYGVAELLVVDTAT